MFYGWYVVGGAFLLAVWAWGLAFYSLGIYIVALGRAHGWSIGAVSVAITAYYLMGAAVTASIGDVMRRIGAHRAVAAGVVAMAAAVASLGAIDRLWQLYVSLAVMAAGWAAMSSAAINVLVAPWFERRRGVAVSLALTGASGGGIIVAPAMLILIAHVGFAPALWIIAIAMLATLLPVAIGVFRWTPEQLGVGPDGDVPRPVDAPSARSDVAGRSWRRSGVLRSRAYWTISIAFAMGLAAQVGVITHLVSHLTPLLGAAGAGGALGITTIAAIVGRFPMGALADRMDRRAITALNFLMQVAGLALLAMSSSSAVVYAGCALFGLGVGNVIALPGLLVEREFPREHFAGIVSLITATNQLAFAFAPGLIGLLRDATGSYGLALALCATADLVAAGVVYTGRARRAPSRATVADLAPGELDPGEGRSSARGVQASAQPAAGPAVGLTLRPNCECCDRDLPPDSREAVICSFECTFCRGCAETLLAWRCPNCGGELVRRPVRPSASLHRHPASTARVRRPVPCGTAA